MLPSQAGRTVNRSGLILLASPFVLVASCIGIRGPAKIWVHPEIRGTVLDDESGLPVAGAIVRSSNSRCSGETVTADDGTYVLPAVSETEWVSLPGDPFYGTHVEASAESYNRVVHETGHGTGEVYGDRPAPIRQIDFRLSMTGTGESKETIVHRK